MRRTFAFPLLGIATTALVACQRGYEYSPPALPPQAAAIITGSKLHNPDPFKDDTRAYLVAIVGKLTLDGPRGWDDRTVVAPGTHAFKLGVARGPGTAWGFGETQASLEGGKTYVIRAIEPVQITSVCATSVVWLEGDDGSAITDRVPVVIGTYTGGEAPLPGGGFVNIPSHTTCPTK
jgi:hypothetical protein